MQITRYLKFSLALTFIIFIRLTGIGPLSAQLLHDSVTIDLIKKGIGSIYNLEFNDAEVIYTRLNTKYPGHPATFLYKGILIYYKNYPLLPTNPESRSFERQLHTSIKLCENTEGWLDDPEKLLIDLCSRGLLLLFYTENEMSKEVIPIVFSTYRCVMKSFQFESVYPDFSYFTGLYNYYREAYPEYRPVYKPVALLFSPGDKRKGLEQLQYSAKNSMVMKAESYAVLSWINIIFEKDYVNALTYSRTLQGLYPSNLLFKGEYIKVLVLLKKYDEAENMIHASLNDNNPYLQAQLAIFSGLIQEKKYRNITEAEKYYKRGIDGMEQFRARGKDYTKLGHRGLARLKDIKSGLQPGKRRDRALSNDIDPDILDN